MIDQKILKQTIKDMERQIKEQQEIIDRLKKLVDPIKPAQKYYEPEIKRERSYKTR